MVTLSTPLLLFPSKIFRQGNKFFFLVLGVYSALFNIVIEALNLVLEKIFSQNPAAWQYQNIAQLLSTPQSSTESFEMPCHRRFPSHHMSIFSQTVDMTSLVKLQSQCKTCSHPKLK
jgi:hypothetical protein